MSGPGRLKRPSRGPAEGYMEFAGRRSLLSLATSLSGLVRELFAGMPSRLLVTSVIGGWDMKWGRRGTERERGELAFFNLVHHLLLYICLLIQ